MENFRYSIFCKTCLPVLITLFTIGCASNYRAIPQLITQPPPGDLQPIEAVQDLRQHTGTTVRWGGTVIAVEQRNQASYIHVVHSPLDDYGRPLRNSRNTQGRFLVAVPDPQDKQIARDLHLFRGALLTVNGNITGSEEVKIGQHSAKTAIISVNEIYVWPRNKRARHYHPYYGDPFYYHHRHYYWYHRHYYYPYRYCPSRRLPLLKKKTLK